ncbi:hypothetical protein ACFPIJ_16050 [Dactylosporangium cerinum]|uniref:Nucleoside-diphosphate sugar epimerase n=1 Tax=Dactylosporangium cerinum TaxID=1434730 RepID=A0ABV9VUK2_9ACTN
MLLSGLGAVRGSTAGTLTAGAQAAVATGIDRIIWLGALGTGPSAGRPDPNPLARGVARVRPPSDGL